MADRDINIRVKAPGVSQVKADIDSVKKSLSEIPTLSSDINRSTDKAFADGMKNIEQNTKAASDATAQMTSTTMRLGSTMSTVKAQISAMLSSLAAFAVFKVGGGLIRHFDELIAKQEQVIRGNENVRKSFDGLFESTGQYDEQGRKRTAMAAQKLLQQTSTPAGVGIPTIEEYVRQFGGRMAAGDYQAGMKQVLGYAARHGQEATPDLIQLMRGYGIDTAAGQSQFMRKIMGASGASGMTDREVISTMGRVAPAARAMGLSPERTLDMISALSAGEIGKNKMTVPVSSIEAMMQPSNEKFRRYGITGKTPDEVFQSVKKAAARMNPNSAYQMLEDIYGGGANGISKMITGGVPTVSPISAAADAAEQKSYEGTLEGKRARQDAINMQYRLNTSAKDEAFSRAMSEFQEQNRLFEQEHPWHSWAIDMIPGPQTIKTMEGAKKYQEQNPGAVSIIHNNNMYIEQTPPDAQPRSSGGY